MPAYNCAERLPRSVEAILGCDYPSFEIIIAEGGSQDDTREIAEHLERTHSNVRVLAGLPNTASGKRNRGIDAARGEFVAFTDDDCYPTPTWLTEFVRAAGNGRILTGRTLPKGTGHAAAMRTSRKPRVYKPNLLNMATCWRPGASNNFFAPRELLLGLGPFDESLGPGSANGVAEDLEYNFRAMLNGIAIQFVPEAEIWHDTCETHSQLVRKKTAYARGLFYFLCRYYVPRVPALAMGAVCLCYYLAGLTIGLLTFRRTKLAQHAGELHGAFSGMLSGLRMRRCGEISS
jgi:glycosyltransferase involved in cell wall biosynthesis